MTNGHRAAKQQSLAPQDLGENAPAAPSFAGRTPHRPAEQDLEPSALRGVRVTQIEMDCKTLKVRNR